MLLEIIRRMQLNESHLNKWWQTFFGHGGRSNSYKDSGTFDNTDLNWPYFNSKLHNQHNCQNYTTKCKVAVMESVINNLVNSQND